MQKLDVPVLNSARKVQTLFRIKHLTSYGDSTPLRILESAWMCGGKITIVWQWSMKAKPIERRAKTRQAFLSDHWKQSNTPNSSEAGRAQRYDIRVTDACHTVMIAEVHYDDLVPLIFSCLLLIHYFLSCWWTRDDVAMLIWYVYTTLYMCSPHAPNFFRVTFN